MTTGAPHAYRFASAAQWRSGLFATADTSRDDGLRPFASFASEPTRIPAPDGSRAPAFLLGGTLIWCGGDQRLHILAPEGDRAEAVPAPGSLVRARRIAAGPTAVWVAGNAPGTVDNYATESWIRRFVVDLEPGNVVDLARDGSDGAWVLKRSGGSYAMVHVSCAGRIGATIDVPCAIGHPTAVAFVRDTQRLLVLANGGRTLWVRPTRPEQTAFSIDLDRVRPCFAGEALASDGFSRVMVAGIDADAFGGGAALLVFDADGDLLSTLALPGRATGVAARRQQVVVTTASSVLSYGPASAPGAGRAAAATFITPALHSPPGTSARRWLRVQARARLPRGTSLQLSYAATSDPRVRNSMASIAADTTLTQSTRVQRIRRTLERWSNPVTFRSEATDAPASDASLYAAPLHDVHDDFVWILVSLIAAPGAAMPEVTQLEVLYPAPSLMDNLPAVFRKDLEDPGSFLPRLVGALETTTQELDARIGRLGQLMDARTTTSDWLDFMARWLGLPWDDGLSDAQKRCILEHGPALLARRGTRAALKELLECLLPAGRFRLVDYQVDYERARTGCAEWPGARLPARLDGLPAGAIVLNRKAVIGRSRLPCDTLVNCDGRAGNSLRIDIFASAQERAQWSPWLRAVVEAMVPFSLGVQLRWLPVTQLQGESVLGEALELPGVPDAQIGVTALTGRARLSRSAPVTIQAPEIDAGFRLQ